MIPGQTCWRTEPSARAALLIDDQAHYSALFEAMRAARRSILILGWSFDPRARLLPDGQDGPDDPDEIGHVLLDLAREKPGLDIRLLIWKSAFPIAATQEFFPHRARKWFKGTRVQFRLDDQVPMGACHHQKVVVIDDRLAFCGSGDISVDRWDTPGHLEFDQRRIMPDQDCHAPRHEVTMMVDGAAAAALGEHFRERWRRGAKSEFVEPQSVESDPWPTRFPAHLADVQVSIARTTPAWRGQPAVREIQNLTLACIARADRVIYLENQYFASPVIAEALARRLAEPDGPEVVLIATGMSPSYFDRSTMDAARGIMLRRLQAADHYGRLRALHPVTRAGSLIIVHSKTSVFDDRVIRVGSANINNRSYGFDTEIELAIEVEDENDRLIVAGFRNRLIGHFLGHTGDAVAKAILEQGSVCRAIDALNKDGRLAAINARAGSPLSEFVGAWHMGDPSDRSDAFRLGLRRRRLQTQVRAVRGVATSDQIEIHHQGQVVGGASGERIERGEHVGDVDLRTDEMVVDAQHRQG